MADITLKAYIAHLDDLLGRRSYEEAEAHATQILSRFPRNLQALIRLGKAQIEAGHYNDAEGTFTQVLGMDPRSTDAYVGLSWVARQRGDGERAIALLERAFEHDPANQDVIQLLIDANRSFRDRHSPKLPQTAYMIARQQWHSGLTHQALATIKSALDAAPGRTDLELLRAQIYQSSGAEIDAARSATDVVKKMPDCIEANRMLAEFWKRQGRSSDAQKFISRVESADPVLAYEIASGGPPPDGTFTLPLYDFRAVSNKASTAAKPEWLAAISNVTDAADSIEPAQAAESTADWLEAAEPVLDENNSDEFGWVADAIGMPDDLSWLDQAAAEPMEFDFDEQPAAPAETLDTLEPADFGLEAVLADQPTSDEAEEFNLDWMMPSDEGIDEEPVADADLDLSWAEAPDESTVDNAPAWGAAPDVTPEVEQWIEDQAADEGDTLPSMTTMKAEQDRTTSEMAAAEPVTPPAAEEWLDLSALDAQTDGEPIEDFDEFLRNFTAFGDMDTEEPRPDLSAERTGLTGLLATAGGSDIPPEAADIDPEDPLAWMRSGTVDHEVYASEEAREDEMPELDDLLSPTGGFEAYSGDVARELDGPMEPATAGAEDDDADPLAWLREHDDIEMVENAESQAPRWSDALDVEAGVELDSSDADPLAWMHEAGVTVDDESEQDQEADPLAWAKEDGLELVDEVVEVTYKRTEALVDPDAPRSHPETNEEPATPTSTGMTGLLAFIKADGEDQEGDSPMSEHETPHDEPESEPSGVQPEAPQAREEFDWMAAAEESGADDIDWDAVPGAEEDADAAIPDWLAAVSNPVDSAEAAALSAADDPNVSDLWDPGADEVEGGDVPEWMAALRDESPAPEAQTADEVGEWLFSEAEPNVEASEDIQPMPIQPESVEGEAVPDQPAEVGDAVSELADWIGATGLVAAGAAALSDAAPDEDQPESSAEVAAAADADSGETPDWLSALNEAEDGTSSAQGTAVDAAVDSVAPDEAADADFMAFLNSAGQEAADAVSEAVEPVDDSLDWLNADDEADSDVPAADAADIEAEADDLPDWLAEAGAGEVASSEAADEALDWLEKDEEVADSVPVPQEPDWFSEVDTGRMAAEPADETPDWLKDVEPATDEAGAESGDLAWLDDSQNVIGDATNIQPDLADAGEPSYELSYLEGEESTEAVETIELEPDNELELGAAAAAMLDADVPSGQLEAQRELSGEILDDADLLEPELPADETLTASATNSPDWLNAMVPGLEVNVSALEDADGDESGEFFNAGKSDFSWLNNIVDEELAPPTVGAPSRRPIRFPFDEPPVWLRGLRDETQTSTPVATADNDDDALPEWLRFDDDAQTN